MQKDFAYVRVSSRDQNTDRQIEAIRKYVHDERAVFTDKQSGYTFERAAYQALKLQLRPGDTVYIKSLDRFGRNKDEIKRELEKRRNHRRRLYASPRIKAFHLLQPSKALFLYV